MNRNIWPDPATPASPWNHRLTYEIEWKDRDVQGEWSSITESRGSIGSISDAYPPLVICTLEITGRQLDSFFQAPEEVSVNLSSDVFDEHQQERSGHLRA